MKKLLLSVWLLSVAVVIPVHSMDKDGGHPLTQKMNQSTAFVAAPRNVGSPTFSKVALLNIVAASAIAIQGTRSNENSMMAIVSIAATVWAVNWIWFYILNEFGVLFPDRRT